MAPKNGVYVACEICGKITYKTKSQYDVHKHHYCSYECSRMGRSKLHSEDRECEWCGNIFHVINSAPQRFCSIECQHEWQKTNVGDRNPKYTKVTTFCDNCKKEIHVCPCLMDKYKTHFCSSDCRQEWYSNVWSQSDDWREESRQRAANILKNNPQNRNSRPQIIINNLLDDMGIRYENEKVYKYYSVDNYLEDYNLIIEINGDFWHTSPLKYEAARYEQQRNIISRDKAKRTYIRRYHDINILYLWESDICERIDVCEKLISLYIQSNGILENYNSFNYSINSDGELVLNEDIILPFQEKENIAC